MFLRREIVNKFTIAQGATAAAQDDGERTFATKVESLSISGAGVKKLSRRIRVAPNLARGAIAWR